MEEVGKGCKLCGSFAYKMAAFLRVLPTRWWREKFTDKMAAMPRF